MPCCRTTSRPGHAHLLNTLSPRQNGRHFADDIFKWIFLNEKVWISIKISLKFVPQGPINKIPALVKIMAWRRPGDKPLSGPMMVSLPTHICVTRPQWIKWTGSELVQVIACSRIDSKVLPQPMLAGDEPTWLKIDLYANTFVLENTAKDGIYLCTIHKLQQTSKAKLWFKECNNHQKYKKYGQLFSSDQFLIQSISFGESNIFQHQFVSLFSLWKLLPFPINRAFIMDEV